MIELAATPAHGRGRGIDRAWALPVVLVAGIACATAREAPLAVIALILVALVPWALGLLGRAVPDLLFGALGVAPIVVAIVLQDLGAGVFLATMTLCHLASRSTTRPAVAALVVIGIAVPFTAVLSGWPFDHGALYFAIGDLFSIVVGLLLARTRRLGAELRAADARLAAVAAQEDRTRLAREVHDLVAHSLTVVVLQVGGARRVLRADPVVAEQALEQAERVCRESLDGIREIVGLLRADGEPAASVDLVRLAETYRAASVEVDLRLEGDMDGLPLLVRGTLHRVVQEALANAARYREIGSPVSVSVTVDAEGVSARVRNAGADARRTGPGGYGLTGLREQVSAIGGTLRGGPDAAGWLVECRLPRTASTVRVDAVTA